MQITLTPTSASLTANTISGPVTLPLNPAKRVPTGVWRQMASHAPRPRFVRCPLTGIQIKTF